MNKSSKIIPIRMGFLYFFQNINFKYSSNFKPQLGRWQRDYDKQIINRKIELANEDHCGVCNEYLKNKRKN